MQSSTLASVVSTSMQPAFLTQSRARKSGETPLSGLKFFSGTPLLPVRAGIIANTSELEPTHHLRDLFRGLSCAVEG